jgi:hypothetical protein
MKKILALVVIWIVGGHVYAEAEALTSGSQTRKPEIFLQILNGIAPDPIDIEVDGKIRYPGMGPGARISTFPLPSEKTKLVLIDKKSGNRKTLPLELAEGHYTLIVSGDFQPVPGGEKLKEGELPVRVITELYSNLTTAARPAVRVHLINGVPDKAVVVKGPGGKSWKIEPMKLEVLSGLPEKLFLEASYEQGAKRSLYLAQESPAKNIAIVFYPAGQNLAFRAMTEFTPEGAAADKKRAEESEKKEAAEAMKSTP